MRVLSVLLLVAALLISGYMFFVSNSMQTQIDDCTDRALTEQTIVDSYKKTSEEQLTQIEEKKDTLNELNEELISAEDHAYYKTHRGAFLTFDDGPNDNTDKILDILKTNDVTATFFIVASQVNTDARRATLKRIVDEGHAVAIHCNTHDYKTIYASEDAFFEDLYKAQSVIYEVTGVRADVIRFPGGSSTAKEYFDSVDPDLFLKVIKRLYDEGFEINDWTCDTNDYSETSTSNVLSAVQKNITARTKASVTYKTCVVLMHNKNVTVSALQKIIDAFKTEDFEFDTLKANHYCRTQYDYDALLKELEQ